MRYCGSKARLRWTGYRNACKIWCLPPRAAPRISASSSAPAIDPRLWSVALPALLASEACLARPSWSTIVRSGLPSLSAPASPASVTCASPSQASAVRATPAYALLVGRSSPSPTTMWSRMPCGCLRSPEPSRIMTSIALPAWSCPLPSTAKRNEAFSSPSERSAVPSCRCSFDRRFFAETRPFGAHVWRIGAGANMAFRRSAFATAGVFDERLGAGASGCSEDSELWYRLLAVGGSCLYEPRAVVFHHHRAGWDELTEQMRVYMRGHVSALVAQADAFGDRGNFKRIAVQLPRYFLRTGVACLVRGEWRRLALLTAEVRGWLAGLGYLFRPAWRRGRGEWLRQ